MRTTSQRLNSSTTQPKKVRQRATAERIKLPLLHSCPGGFRQSSIHSPWRREKFVQDCYRAIFLRGRATRIDSGAFIWLHPFNELANDFGSSFVRRFALLVHNASHAPGSLQPGAGAGFIGGPAPMGQHDHDDHANDYQSCWTGSSAPACACAAISL